jgi:hypothetical protein
MIVVTLRKCIGSIAKKLTVALCVTLLWLQGGCVPPPFPSAERHSTSSTQISPALSGSDDAFLDDLERRAVCYFIEQSDDQTGLVSDRARADGSDLGRRDRVASIAATGFGLTALCLADYRGWIDHADAYRRVLTALRSLRDRLPNVHGFFYHFVDRATGARRWDCEVSSIDTALLMAGVLTARQYFHGTEAEIIAQKVYDRVEWPWMLAGGDTLSMGWKPQDGFLKSRWDRFSELPILYLLGLGSMSHPLPPACWRAWRRGPVVTYAGRTFMQFPPLFVHQYPHAWIDFRNERDAFADYWQNSVDATLAHRQFCIDLSIARHLMYRDNLWGVTASDSARGYVAWGGPPADAAQAEAARQIDGTVVPSAAAGSLPFAPNVCLRTLRFMHDQYGSRVYGRYGFIDAFNPVTGWTDRDVIGIDVGVTLLMAENARTGWVWDCFMQNPEIRHAMDAAGFHPTSPTLRPKHHK